MSDQVWVKIKLPMGMNNNIEYRISNKEPQNVECNPSTFDIQYSICCGSKRADNKTENYVDPAPGVYTILYQVSYKF